MNKVEEVARALLKAQPRLSRLEMDDCRAMARAAIESMRSPSVAMLKAYDGVLARRTNKFDEVYKALIDAALQE